MCKNENLLIPINVQALCIGKGDVENLNNRIVVEEADFSQLPYRKGNAVKNKGPYTSETVLKRPFNNNTRVINEQDVGVHLHWSLPSALTHSSGEEVGLEFPQVPNRWLIARLINQDVTNINAWVVESDFIGLPDPKEKSSPITIPAKISTKMEGNYRYLGRAVPLENWQEDKKTSPLTAVGYGSLLFSASYQNSRSVFGFHDDLTLIKEEKITSPLKLMYVVIGWYSDPQNDFIKLADVKNLNILKQWLKENNWRLEDGQQQHLIASPSVSTLYHGAVYNIDWVSTKEYLKLDSTQDKDIKISLASTGIEAFSAYLSGKTTVDKKNKESIETQLNAFQLENVDKIPTNEYITTLHNQRFSPIEGGESWVIKSYHTGNEKSFNPYTEADNLTQHPELKDPLNQLNQLQTDYDRQCLNIEGLRWQIFVDWYKYLNITYTNSESEDYKKMSLTQESVKEYIVAEMSKVKDQLSQLSSPLGSKIKTDIVTKLKELSTTERTYELLSIPAPRYYIPKDPTVMLELPWPFFADERNLTADSINIRISSQLSQIQPKFNLANTHLGYADDFTRLITEASTRIQENAQEEKNVPESFSLQKWKGCNPWLPLKIEWETKYIPLKRDLELPNIKNYSPGHAMDNLELSTDQELHHKVDFSIGQETHDKKGKFDDENIQTYTGSFFFHKSEISHFLNLIDNLISESKEDEKKIWQKLRDEIAKVNLYTLNLDGFFQALIMRQKTLQMAAEDPLAQGDPFDKSKDYIEFSRQVKEVVSDMNLTAPLPEGKLSSFCDGGLQLTKLRIVDVFGQYKDISINTQNFTIPAGAEQYSYGEDHYMLLAPRIVQPARLSIRLMESDTLMPMNNLPNSQPIFGWLVINKLDQSIMLYSHNGDALGSLIDNGEKIIAKTAPYVYSANKDLCEDILKNNAIQLYSLAKCMIADRKLFNKILNTIDKRSEYIHGGNVSDDSSTAGFMSSPIALVKAKISLQLQTDPAVDESYESLSTDMKNNHLGMQRDHNNFSAIQFPIQLGNKDDPADGLIGYFHNKDNAESIDYSNFSSTLDKNSLLTTAIEIEGSSSTSQVKYTTLLCDLRCGINIITGILPTKIITIPEEKYLSALKAIRMSFFAGPVVLTESVNKNEVQQTQINLPIPQIKSGSLWTWIENKDTSTSHQKFNVKNIFQTSDLSSMKVIKEGWLMAEDKPKKK